MLKNLAVGEEQGAAQGVAVLGSWGLGFSLGVCFEGSVLLPTFLLLSELFRQSEGSLSTTEAVSPSSRT